jgi:predicted ABC-type ATPase
MMISEGPLDKNIFKVIFMAGIPGAGKTTISKKLQGGTSLKRVDFDEIYNLLKKVKTHSEISNVLNNRILSYVKGRLGMIIDKTSQNYDEVLSLKKDLSSIGYDTMMVYINSDIDIAIKRVAARYEETGRKVDIDYIERVFKNLSTNMGKFQSEFKGNMIVIDNSATHATSSDDYKYAEREISKFINSPPTDQLAKKWMEKRK